MLKLNGKAIESNLPRDSMFSLSTSSDLPFALRSQKAYVVHNTKPVPEGFAHYVTTAGSSSILPKGSSFTKLDEDFRYLNNDDVVSISGDGRVRTLLRASSDHNSILLTEQCDNYCLMCSQPPKDHDDSWILEEVSNLIPLIPRDTQSLGITGGEPTIFGDDFINIIRLIKNWLPHTAVHILSNGRKFADPAFSQKYAAICHPDMMVGIPVYSDDPTRHDYVVQAKGAFDETIRGILNLKKLGQKVELRVVIHKQTYEGLPSLAEYIARNLLFVDHVALMGLEMMGFTRANLDSLWIDPISYKDYLSEAVNIFRSYGMVVSVYNHQLCLVNKDIEPVYVKSISDWKNEYLSECNSCSRINDCGGFFSSGVRYGYSKSITPFQN
jgi:His-Xaa-Ser system radical SAM maturase HxsC